MIQTADTDYAADYEKPMFWPKISQNCLSNPKQFPKIFFLVIGTKIWLSYPKNWYFYMIISIGGADYSHR